MADRVRVRFAPSPTGDPHVGSLRTAIFNWLFARHSRGSFVLRIEDTDQSRKVEGATEAIAEALRWLGIDWDEGPEVGGDYGPYVQSERLGLYHAAADDLIARGAAYRCFCSTDRLRELRDSQAKRKESTQYDRLCKGLTDSERAEREAAGEPSVVRFAMPTEGVTSVTDLIRGGVDFENRLIDDFVVIKSDGFPTYHLANVVDDHAMEITHVLRAEEWLPSTPRHVRMYDALEWRPPKFAHLPIILAPDRSKLSKRHGATSVMDYRRMGYLPHAMVNFLALIGWSLDDKTEVFSVEELVESFSIDGVARSGALFDMDKLIWMNGTHIRRASAEELADDLLDFWRRNPPVEIPDLPARDRLVQIVPLIQERLKTLGDAAPLIPFFFTDTVEYETDDLIQKKMDAPGTKNALVQAGSKLEAAEDFDAPSLEALLRPLGEELGIKVGQLLGSLRVALTGLRVSPPLFETMELLGKERTVTAVKAAIERL